MSTPSINRLAPNIDRVHRWLSACLAPRRIEILLTLHARGESSMGSLADSLELERSSVSHAIASLRDEGLVTVRADGRRRLYSLGEPLRIDVEDGAFRVTLHHPSGYAVHLERVPFAVDRGGRNGVRPPARES